MRLIEKSARENITMAFDNNKGENEFPYEIKEAEGDVKEQFIKNFEGKFMMKKNKKEFERDKWHGF